MDDTTEYLLEPGRRFGAYEIVRPLGQGAFGAVYEALRLPLRKRTALKVLHQEHVRQAEVVERFTREAEIVAQLDHPHIVVVFDVGVEDGSPYLAMEFLEGESLASRLERERVLEPSNAVDLVLAVASALSAVHERGIVHRDLKPDNVFLAQRPAGGPTPKLLDFGVAKIAGSSNALTRTSAMVGTPFYMSPEQAEESKTVGPASDQWALGVMFYQCVTGELPFRGDSLLALLNAITSKPFARPAQLKPGLPPALDAAILRALNRDPAGRFPSVKAFGAALLASASPAVREHWSPFFLDSADAAAVARPSVSGAAADGSSAGFEPTLRPTTRSLIGFVPGRGSSRGTWAAGVAALLTASAAGVWLTVRPPSQRRSATSVPPTTVVRVPIEAATAPAVVDGTAAPAAAAEAPTPPVAPAAPATPSVRLVISSAAPHAFAVVRRERHPLPWEAELSRSTVPEIVEVRAHGRAGLRFMVPLDGDHRLDAALERGRGVDDATPAETAAALGMGVPEARAAAHAARPAGARGGPIEAAAPSPSPAPAPAAAPPSPPQASPAPTRARRPAGEPIYEGPSGTIPSEL